MIQTDQVKSVFEENELEINKIFEMVKVIKDMADQINHIALNAGTDKVTQEIIKMSETISQQGIIFQEMLNESNTKISTLSNAVNDVMDLFDPSNGSLEEIAFDIEGIFDLISTLADSLMETTKNTEINIVTSQKHYSNLINKSKKQVELITTEIAGKIPK